MSTAEILNSIIGVFKSVLDNDSVILTFSSTADDVQDWDSLTHIQLVLAIEKFFKIRFTSAEIIGFKNVGEMVNCIEGKLMSKA